MSIGGVYKLKYELKKKIGITQITSINVFP